MDPMTKVSVRDFAIFQVKLLIDGLKDGAVFAVDLVFRRQEATQCWVNLSRRFERPMHRLPGAPALTRLHFRPGHGYSMMHPGWVA